MKLSFIFSFLKHKLVQVLERASHIIVFRRLVILSIFVILNLMLSSCSLFGPVSTDAITQYQLTATPCSLQKSQRKVTILVTLPNTIGVNNTNEMSYSIKPYQIAYFSKNRWVDTPSQMLEPLIVESLEKTHFFSSVGIPSSIGSYDYVLNTDITQFNQVFFTQHSVFRFKLRAQIVNTATTRIVASRDFCVEEVAPYYSPYGGVIAANRAASHLLTQLSNWVIQQNLKQRYNSKIIIKEKTTVETETKS